MDVSFGRKALRAFKIARAYLYYALPHRSHRKPFHWRMPEDVIWSWLGSGPVWATAKTPAILNMYWTDISLWKLMEIDGNLYIYIISAFKRIFSNHWKRLWYMFWLQSPPLCYHLFSSRLYTLCPDFNCYIFMQNLNAAFLLMSLASNGSESNCTDLST